MTGSHYSACQSRDRVTLLRAILVSPRLSVVSWVTLGRRVLPVGQDLVKGQAKSGWTMSTVLGVSPPWPRATSMVGESITVLTVRMQGLSVQVSRCLCLGSFCSDNEQLSLFLLSSSILCSSSLLLSPFSSFFYSCASFPILSCPSFPLLFLFICFLLHFPSSSLPFSPHPTPPPHFLPLLPF